MFKLVLEKAEEPEIKLPTSTGSSKKQGSYRKNIYFCFTDYAKAFDCVDHNKLWKILKVKGLGIANKAEIDVFLEISHFFDDPADVGNLISGSSVFSKSSLNNWKFMVHVLLKPGLENLERYFASG